MLTGMARIEHVAPPQCRLSSVLLDVALNCVLIHAICSLPSVENIYVPSGCGDAGSAMGCVILTRHAMGASVHGERLKSPQLGIDADPEFIHELLRRHGIDHECFLERDDPGLDPCNQSFSLVGALVRRSKFSWIHETRVQVVRAVAWML